MTDIFSKIILHRNSAVPSVSAIFVQFWYLWFSKGRILMLISNIRFILHENQVLIVEIFDTSRFWHIIQDITILVWAMIALMTPIDAVFDGHSFDIKYFDDIIYILHHRGRRIGFVTPCMNTLITDLGFLSLKRYSKKKMSC